MGNTRNIVLTMALATSATMALSACSGCKNMASDKHDEEMKEISLTKEQRQMCDSTNAFAWRMMAHESGKAGTQSVVVSPLSMIYCLGMVNAGAAGATSDEITRTLGFADGSADINSYCAALLREMPHLDKSTTMSIANCVEVNKPYTLLPDYISTVKNSYDALVENRDFADAGFKDYINGWVGKHTGGMIPQMFDSVEPSAVAYIINALYFKGQWTLPFDKQLTHGETFHAADGTDKKVDMMRQTESFSYAEDTTMQVLSMDYGCGNYSMQLLLPHHGKTIADALGDAQKHNWQQFVSTMGQTEVHVKLPRFTIEYGGEMNGMLEQLGIRQVFGSQADLSRLSWAQTHVSQIVQKAKIEVDEEGAKAAAATAAMIELTSAGPRNETYFYADRPFIFVITERTSGTICFMGQYTGM